MRCEVCSKPLEGVLRRFCSAECGNTWVLSEASQRLPKRFLKGIKSGSSRNRRRAFRSGEFVLSGAVFEAWDWQCHLCNRIINMKLKHPHPLAASIDHLTELKNGGQHIWENLAPAHQICNWTKTNVLK